nr:SpoIIE family protein phosphatase [Bacteroidales bacterium]
PASLVMAVTRSLFRSTSAHESNPGRIVSHINDAISEGNETNMFVTFFTGILDLLNGQLHYCNAGHNAPLRLSEGDSRPIDVMANVPLGVLEDYKFKTQECVLPQGSTLFLFTDGLTEAENDRKELFGEQRLEDITRQIASKSTREQIQSIGEAIRQHVQEAPQSDDMTMLCIKYLGCAGDRKERHLSLQNDIQEIPQLADFIEHIAEETEISQADALSINLALEEAVANVILYAYPEGTDGLVDIEAVIRGRTIHFAISDSGMPFDPTQIDDVDIDQSLEDRPIGGLGIHLVRNIMDNVYYERSEGKNILHMTKKL